MESKEAPPPSPPPTPSPLSSSSSAVCCMCGDRGLVTELFRCTVCLERSQHRYCSDLYPNSKTYKVCNWCLRDEEGGAKADHHNNSMSSLPEDRGDGGDVGSGGGLRVMLHRGCLPSHLNKPVKKLRLLKRSSSDVIHRTRSGELLPSSPGTERQLFRGKVRRYKLLEDVSS